MTTPATVRPIAVKLDTSTLERMKRVGIARDRSTHWMLREAVQQYLDREEKSAALRDAGHKAWAHYQATGLHLTEEEADGWLEALEAGGDVAPPKCHV